MADKGTVRGGSVTAAEVAVKAASDVRIDKVSGLRVCINDHTAPGASVHIGAAYCEDFFLLHSNGAPDAITVVQHERRQAPQKHELDLNSC